MKARVCVIEDEPELAELITLYLEQEGFETAVMHTAEQALKAFESRDFDLITLDICLPGMDGFEFLQECRMKFSTPVIIVSAREADEDIVLGLGLGADEYVQKPFAPKVLVARVRAMLRRAQLLNDRAGKTFSFGPYTIDFEAFVLKKEEHRIALSTKEFDVLAFLVKNAGKALSQQEIYTNVWGNRYGDLTTVAVYIQRLRKKLCDSPFDPCYIKTIHGKGYLFNLDIIQEGPT